MAVGEDKDNAIKVPSVPRKNAGFDGKIFKKTSVLKYSKGKRIAQEPKNEGAMKRMSSGDGMDTYKKKPKDEAFSSSAIVKKPRRGDGKPMGNLPRQMKDPKKDAMVSKGGKVKVIAPKGFMEHAGVQKRN